MHIEADTLFRMLADTTRLRALMLLQEKAAETVEKQAQACSEMRTRIRALRQQLESSIAAKDIFLMHMVIPE